MSSNSQQIILQNCKAALKEVERRVTANGSSANPDIKSSLSSALGALRAESSSTRSTTSSSAGGSSNSGPLFATLLLRDGSVLTVLLSSLLWKKRKVAEASLTALRSLVPCPAFQMNTHVTLFRLLTHQTSTSASSSGPTGPNVHQCRAGEGLFIALSYLLSNTSESALQLRTVQFLYRLLRGDSGRLYLTGRAVPDTVGACFTMAMQASQEAVRHQCRDALHACLQCVTKTFVLESCTPPGAVQIFATTTILDNYTVDVEHDAAFEPIQVVDSSLFTMAAPQSSLAPSAAAGAHSSSSTTNTPLNQPPQSTPLTEGGSHGTVRGQDAVAADAGNRDVDLADHPSFPDQTLDPNHIFSRSDDATLLGWANWVLSDSDRLPAPLKNFIVILKHACRLASLPCSGSVSESNTDIRARELGLEMLERIMSELPVANSPSEHQCAMWLSLAFASCRYNLMRCLTLNLSSIQPFSFFAAAVRITTLLLRKCHYHLARELNSMLSVFLIPLVGSRYASFQQKHAVVSMVHSLFSVPHLVISFFVNYDCNPSFDAGGESGGILEQLIDLVTEMTFKDYSASSAGVDAGNGGGSGNNANGNDSGDSRGLLTADQETLLRCECLTAVHALVFSLYRWTTEDPKTYVLGYLQQAQQHAAQTQTEAHPTRHTTPTPAGIETRSHSADDQHKPSAAAAAAHGGGRCAWSELYLDNWESSDDESDSGGAHGKETNGTLEGPSNAVESASATESGASRSMSFAFTGGGGLKNLPVPLWGKMHNVLYHWKHVHFLWHNKRLMQEAVALTNSGKWKEAMSFLIAKQVLQCIAPVQTPRKEDEKLSAAAAAAADSTTTSDAKTATTADQAAKDEANRRDAEAQGDEEEVEEEEETLEPGTTPYAPFARFLHDFPGIQREAICRIFERINKDPASKQVLLEYLHMFDYRGVPIDVALRDTTCKFMSWDRPMFEAGVWETIQSLFGAEYARQNRGSITASDADTMAGVLLFLHANLHNDIAKGSRMTCRTFVQDGNACLTFPMEERDIAAMYERVAQHKWELDDFGRTPQQQETARSGMMQLSTKIRYERSVARSAAQLTRDLQLLTERVVAEGQGGTMDSIAASSSSASNLVAGPQHGSFGSGSKDTAMSPMLENVDQSVLQEVLRDVQHQGWGGGTTTGSMAMAASSAQTNNSNGSISATRGGTASARAVYHDDIGYLDCSVPNYCEVKDTLRLREPQHQQFAQIAMAHLAKLESLHRQFFCRGDQYHPQPYIVPYYAEHVKLILLSAYPQIAASIYMGFRVLDESPIRRQLIDTQNLLFDLAAAFVMNVGDLREVVDHTIQQYLGEEQAYRLFPPSRPTLVSFFLNYI